MKKLLTLALCALLGSSVLTGCTGSGEAYTEKTYTTENEQITGVSLDVRDRSVEITPSPDGKIHIEYQESEKETYDISISEGNVLTMAAVSNKEWTDYIGGKAPADTRTISVQVPDALLDNLSITTTNGDITVTGLAVNGSVSLDSNGGNISVQELSAQSEIVLTVKNGNIAGTIAGSYDDYAIDCTIKKGKSNLPEKKEGGSKQLTVRANNGDVNIEIN